MDEATGRPKVLVAIGVNPSSERLLLRASKLAQGLAGTLVAVHIHPPGTGTEASHAIVDWHLDHAREIGAEVHIIAGTDIAEALVQFGREQHVSHLVLGQSDISRWQEAVRGSVLNRILRMRSGIDLYIVAEEGR